MPACALPKAVFAGSTSAEITPGVLSHTKVAPRLIVPLPTVFTTAVPVTVPAPQARPCSSAAFFVLFGSLAPMKWKKPRSPERAHEGPAYWTHRSPAAAAGAAAPSGPAAPRPRARAKARARACMAILLRGQEVGWAPRGLDPRARRSPSGSAA